jgi:CRP-like cAMP-binding protein
MLAPQLTRVGLNRRAILQERNRRLEDVHFIEAGVASILAWTPQDGPVQVGLVGRFGLVGVAGSPHRCLMQTDGEALRVSGDELAKIVDAFPSFRHQILNYVHFLLIQNSQFALCNARHELEARVSRLLLLTLDRLDGDIIPVIHDQLSMMLGVRRAGITETLATLESAGAVRRCRGAVEITDRTILEARACECYRIIAAERLRRERVPREFCSDAELVL